MTASGQTTAALSVVIPNYRRPALLRACLRSVEGACTASRRAVEVIVVDDGSGDESARLVESEFPGVTLIALPKNRGYPSAVNEGVAASRGKWVLTLNNDTTVEPTVFDQLLAVAESALDVGMVAAQQRFASDPSVIYSAGMQLDRRGHASDRLMGAPASSGEVEPVEVFGPCGAAALYRRALLHEVGGFDERFTFGLEDADVAWRARMRGWRCLYAPDAIVYHDLGATVPHGSELRLFQAGRNRVLLIAKNLDTRQLLRNLVQIVAFDAAYLTFACLSMRTSAPLTGRLAGLRMWRQVRASGAGQRVPVALAPPTPWMEVLRRRRSWGRARPIASDNGIQPSWSQSSDSARVLVLNQYAPPDAASTGVFAIEIARALAADGMQVTFITGQPSYFAGQSRAPRREQQGGVSIKRLALPGRGGRANLARRFAGYVSYLTRAAFTAGRLVATGRADTIVAFHNPPLLPLLGAALAGRRRRYVSVVMDVHPDVLLATGWIRLPRALIALWEAGNRWAYGRADSIAVLSEGMRSVLSEKGVDPAKVAVIPLWADPELSPRRSARPGHRDVADVRARHELGQDDLLLLFSGNMGVTQQLEPIIGAAISLASAPVRFCFVGGGPEQGSWRTRLSGLPNVTFLPFQPDPDYRALLCASDVGVVTLASNLEQLVSPSRALPFLSAGIPLLAVMSPETELGRLIHAYGCGACVATAEEFAHVVEDWCRNPRSRIAAGRGARRAYEQTRNADVLKRRYVELCR